MVCNRCIMVVQDELDKIGVKVNHIVLGEATLENEQDVQTKQKTKTVLEKVGFELIDDRKSRIIEKIKRTIRIRSYKSAICDGCNYERRVIN